ncbi:cystathionine gamma-synthase 1, chloroplastic-like [Lolium rigidum]|uniref:cystathionine gamma-synthase 1, chloroplastic-like n=1 Tax=Lolium rigidum TaxID=89674 RepID=UPI001F5C7CED|nr:cystathionine gamma-synthase 1, chloroplastic-like [Lolium rigidum]
MREQRRRTRMSRLTLDPGERGQRAQQVGATGLRRAATWLAIGGGLDWAGSRWAGGGLQLKCIDIKLVAELCHLKGTLVCIDSTLASSINQKPLTLGADIVVHSATKYIAGHHNAIAGCIGGSQELIKTIRAWHQDLCGAISPDAAYMIIRGLKTMTLRVETQNRTSLRMARLLENHPKIEHVYYPGLKSSPWHHIAESQMTGFGGCESLVQQPAVMSFWYVTDEEKAKNGMKDNLVRFSFGIEKFEDLRDDILQALEKM